MSERDELRDGDLRGVYIESGISTRTREPFCRVNIEYTDRATGKLCDAVGQLDPATVRSMALQWLAAAEAALHDAAVLGLLVDTVGLDVARAAMFVSELREHRADSATDGAED